MGVYSKDNVGNIKQIAGNIVQRLNTRWFLCTRSIENGVEYYTVPTSAQEYFKTIDSYTLYCFGFNEANTTKYPVLRYGNIELDILDFTTEDGSINIGQLMGVFQMFTQDLSTDPKMYFVGNTHKDIDTGVSQEDFDALVNNETQIKSSKNNFMAGGSLANNNGNYNVAIGHQTQLGINDSSVVIGRNSSSTMQSSVAIGHSAGVRGIGSFGIQLGQGTNSTPNSFQVNGDNIYKTDTHTLTVQNAEINGTPAYGVLSGTSAPTTTTVGAVGQFYLDTTNKKLYQCMSITTETIDEVDTNVYEWTNLSESGVSQTDFDNLVNNKVQIVSSNSSFKAGGASSTVNYAIAIGSNSAAKHYGAIAIGKNSVAEAFGGSAGVSIGRNSQTQGNALALGHSAKTTGNDAIQLMQGTNNKSHTLQIKNDNIYNYNTHTLTVNNIEQNGNPVYAVLQGTTAPDTTTVGAVTQFYLNTTDKKLYQCKSITTSETDSTSTYEWQEVGGSGGISNKLYLHSIIMTSSNNHKITTILINSSSNQFNVSSLNDWLTSNGFVVQNMPTDDNSNMYLASGSQNGMIVNGIYSYASNELYCNCSLKDDNSLNNFNISLNNYNFIDTVIQIL